MKDFFSRLRLWGRSPLTLVEATIGISTVIGGLYLLTPLIKYSTALNGASPLVNTLGSGMFLDLYGFLFLVTGLVTLAGIVLRDYKLRAMALFWNIVLRIYGLLVVFLIQGFLPLTWLGSLTVLFITIICYIVVSHFSTILGGS